MTRPLYWFALLALTIGVAEVARSADPWEQVCEAAPAVLDMNCDGIPAPLVIRGDFHFEALGLPDYVRGFYVLGTAAVFARDSSAPSIVLHEMAHYLIWARDPGAAVASCENERMALAVEARAARDRSIARLWRQHSRCR
jgi:hypothetical protein